jgi:hypothetical protein
MTVKTLRRQLAAAIAMTLVSTVALGSSTYAWFTMNKTVKATGMVMQTKVSGNLLICDNNVEASYSTETLTQTRQALLEPVSSISGADDTFWFTVNAKGNGDAVRDEYIAYAENTTLTTGAIDLIASTAGADGQNHPTTNGAGKAKVASAFNTGADSYQISTYDAAAANAFDNAYGYVDYVFYLKATGDEADQYLKLTKLNLLYDGAAVTNGGTVGTNVDKAWRAAVFCSTAPAIGNLGSSNAATTNLKAILSLDGATNQTANKAVNAAAAAPVALAPIAAYNTWSDATHQSLATVDSGVTAYYQVTIRVWLEGEDTTCTSKTYAALDEAWTLDAEFTLTGNSSTDTVTGVSYIGSVAP